jgi:hypothetical protein
MTPSSSTTSRGGASIDAFEPKEKSVLPGACLNVAEKVMVSPVRTVAPLGTADQTFEPFASPTVMAS